MSTPGGGATIGNVTIQPLAFVDDLMDMNNNLGMYTTKHMTFFGDKMKTPQNEKKCNILIINGKPPYLSPAIMVNGKRMEREERIRYLGDTFNTKVSNKDLIKNRVDDEDVA